MTINIIFACNIYCLYNILLDDGLEGDELQAIIEHVMKEVDIDEDGMLSYIEFEHIISRAPDFINIFRISF